MNSSAAVANGVVYVGCDCARLSVLDAASGQVLKVFDAQGPVFSSPAVSNGRVYVGSHDGHLYAFGL